MAEDVEATRPMHRPEADTGGDTVDLTDPVGTLREPDNRIRLLLAIAVVTLLNLLLLITLLVRTDEGLADRVIDVEGQRCLLVEEPDANALYCRR